MKSKELIIIVVVLILIISSITFAFFGGNSPSAHQPLEGSATWMNFELTNINSGETFTIQELNDRPILLESFAVWCPTCTKQQKEIKKLHEEIGDKVTSISLDTDPNEDESKILQHTQSNGFNWHYAISPSTLTQSLIDEFGIGIVNAPSAPVILICPDGISNQLDSGVKNVQELKEGIETCGG